MRLNIVTSKNSEQLYIIKSYRKDGKSTSKIMKKLGNMNSLLPKFDNDREKVLEWANGIAEEMTLAEKRNTDTLVISLSQSKLLEMGNQSLYNGGYLFLQKIYHELRLDKMCEEISKDYRFDFDLSEILSRLLYSRILYPSSKKTTFEESKRYMEKTSFKLHDVYRALDVLSEKMDDIQGFVYTSSAKVVKRNTSVLYYDCTNYFFEIEEEKGMRKYGKSKEHRPLPIVSMGLLMDGNGYPLSFVIYPGNQSEQPTLIPLEKKIIRDFSLSKFVVCTDAGLSSMENRKFNDRGERSYIVTQSIKKMKGHLKDWCLSNDGWRRKGSTKTMDLEDIRKMDTDEIWFKERWINENGLEQRLIVSFSPRHMRYQRNIRMKQIERARASVESNRKSTHVNPNSPSRFIDEMNLTDKGEVAKEKKLFLDIDKIKEEEKYDGFYAVCTTLEDDIEDIIEVNKRRWEIEESFRIMKTDFSARPVYLQKDERIKAHFLTCFLALLMVRIVEERTGHRYTVHQLIKTMKDMDFKEFEGFGYVPTYTRTEVSDALHEAFGFRTDYQINSYKNFKKIFKLTKK